MRFLPPGAAPTSRGSNDTLCKHHEMESVHTMVINISVDSVFDTLDAAALHGSFRHMIDICAVQDALKLESYPHPLHFYPHSQFA
mmetsp:Transcript_28771/g.68536  ORF Transcript_28771/g.68536 Transcript_28771/m.68536 type:complete len:85 (+) Transcript_28771:122-376(+)